MHAALAPGSSVRIELPALAEERVRDLVEGGGFALRGVRQRDGRALARVERLRTLPDLVRPRLPLLVCGLNPSSYAAERGVAFARPGNRFWTAALKAELVPRDRDPFAALECGVGFTDCAKRATARASELHPDEYRDGFERLERLVRRERPRVICFVGLGGWRAALDRRARAGWVCGGFAGRPAYLMPSTSGLNAHASLEDLTRHLQTAAKGPPKPACLARGVGPQAERQQRQRAALPSRQAGCARRYPA